MSRNEKQSSSLIELFLAIVLAIVFSWGIVTALDHFLIAPAMAAIEADYECIPLGDTVSLIERGLRYYQVDGIVGDTYNHKFCEDPAKE